MTVPVMRIGWNYMVILFLYIFSTALATTRPLGVCRSVHDTEGKCVSFESCPPFLEILKSAKSGQLTSEKLRLLQRLTCGFHNNEPMICCPNTEIVAEVFDTKSQGKIKSTTASSEEKVQNIRFPPTVSGIPRVPTTNKDQALNGSLRNHPNFHLIPPLKGCSNSVNSDRIIGGTEAMLAAYPWMARIGYLNVETNELDFYCGGTVINSRYILTAAHCTEEIDEEFRPVVVRLGEHDITTDEDCSPYVGCLRAVDYVIEKVIPHNGYRKDDKSNDIELIRVNRDISFESLAVRPICLPFTTEYDVQATWEKSFSTNRSTKTWVAGWGRTKWNLADGSKTLQELQLPLVSNHQCQRNYSNRVHISEKQICAGGIKAKDSCGGDSGGPLMFPLPLNGDAKFFQVGVVSFGPVQCGQSRGLPGVYTRTKSYLQWILDNMEP